MQISAKADADICVTPPTYLPPNANDILNSPILQFLILK